MQNLCVYNTFYIVYTHIVFLSVCMFMVSKPNWLYCVSRRHFTPHPIASRIFWLDLHKLHRVVQFITFYGWNYVKNVYVCVCEHSHRVREPHRRIIHRMHQNKHWNRLSSIWYVEIILKTHKSQIMIVLPYFSVYNVWVSVCEFIFVFSMTNEFDSINTFLSNDKMRERTRNGWIDGWEWQETLKMEGDQINE